MSNPWERKEKMPLTGIRLFRWKIAIVCYKLGCKISGRHKSLLKYDKEWKDWYCPHCGWIASDEEGFEVPEH